MDTLRIGKFELQNRLFVGTGKYANYDLMRKALDASGCQVVTVAVDRSTGPQLAGLSGPGQIYHSPQHGRLL
jgi:thiazole synthase